MKRTHAKGFTIIELLVVISIIALLISILLPALGTARERGRYVKWQGYSHSQRADTRILIQHNMTLVESGEEGVVKNLNAGDPMTQARLDFEPADHDGVLIQTNKSTEHTAPQELWENTGRWRGKNTLLLNGVNEGYYIERNEILDKLDEVTLHIAVRHVSPWGGDWQRLVDKNGGGTGDPGWEANRYSSTDEFNVRIDPTNQNKARIDGVFAVPEKWHNCTWSIDNQVIAFQSDGNAFPTETHNAGDLSNSHYISVGAPLGFPANEFYAGRIDEMVIFNTNLEVREIEEMGRVGAVRSRN